MLDIIVSLILAVSWMLPAPLHVSRDPKDHPPRVVRLRGR
jgi:hypothetical protein